MHQGCTLIFFSLSFFLVCSKKSFLSSVFQTLTQQKLNKKIWSWPCDCIAFGGWWGRGLIRNWILQKQRYGGGDPMDGNGKSGWGNSCISNVFHSFPNDDPALSSVVDLWVFYWGVWKLSENLGEESGNWWGLKGKSRDSNWLCAEESVYWRGYCEGSVLGQHLGRPSLWEPEEILASVVDCRLEGSLNCFQRRLGFLGRKENIGGERD